MAAGAAGSWGKGVEVPGLAALEKGGTAQVSSVSCASAGNCAAAGTYDKPHVGIQVFVASERKRHWDKAIEVPGLAALDKGKNAELESVSCGTAGNCAAGGYYFTDSEFGQQGFVAVERNGRWGKAIGVPGLATLDKGKTAELLSVSCRSTGSCAVGGFYTDAQSHVQGFVASERNGRWGAATAVPGLGALNTGGNAQVTTVSCASPGNCLAGGQFNTPSPVTEHGFVASERNGHWGTAIEVPGLATLSAGEDAQVSSVSCPSAGNCAVGGYYATDNDNDDQGFVASERNGSWGSAITVTKDLGAEVTSLSCASAGNCAAGGTSFGTFGGSAAHFVFVVSERNGSWGAPVEVKSPGPGRRGTLTSVSCPSAGDCAAGGNYPGREALNHGFVASERNGSWGAATQMPHPGALIPVPDPSRVLSVSCVPDGSCIAGGWYASNQGAQGFLVTQTR